MIYFTRRNDLKADIADTVINSSAKLIVTIIMSKMFHLLSKYLVGLKVMIFRKASAVKILVNTFFERIFVTNLKKYEILTGTNKQTFEETTYIISHCQDFEKSWIHVMLIQGQEKCIKQNAYGDKQIHECI